MTDNATDNASGDKKLRHVVVGIGANVFGGHGPALQLDTVDLVAVADINADVGQARADELGCDFYTDHRKMLVACQPDVTVVMTPHPFHAPIAIDALNAGSHVLVEKPMAVHAQEADAMIAAADANDRLLAVNFQQRLRPEVRAAHDLIESGQLGEIQRVELVEPWLRNDVYYRNAGWRGTWAGEGGGVLMNQAPHGLDLLCHLAGMPQRISAWPRTRYHAIETEDTLLAMLEWENGALGTVFFSTVEAGPRRMEIVGTAGKLRLDQGALTFSRYETDLRQHMATSSGMFNAPALQTVPVQVGTGSGDHTAVYRNFHSAILTGTPLSCDGRQGRMSLELANAMIYSGQTGETVEIPLDREAYVALLETLKQRAKEEKEA